MPAHPRQEASIGQAQAQVEQANALQADLLRIAPSALKEVWSRRFPDPESFDVGREPNRHLAFGHGIHFCAGNAVARMEAQVAFSRLLARFPRFERDGPTVRPDRSRFRVVDALPIALEP